MTDTFVKIRARGCSDTGITDELAARLYSSKGSHVLAIVELRVDETHVKADGSKKRVDLIINTIEPVVGGGTVDEMVDEHVRNIQAALYRNRKLGQDGQLPLENQEPVLADVVAAGKAYDAAATEPDPDEPDESQAEPGEEEPPDVAEAEDADQEPADTPEADQPAGNVSSMFSHGG